MLIFVEILPVDFAEFFLDFAKFLAKFCRNSLRIGRGIKINQKGIKISQAARQPVRRPCGTWIEPAKIRALMAGLAHAAPLGLLKPLSATAISDAHDALNEFVPLHGSATVDIEIMEQVDNVVDEILPCVIVANIVDAEDVAEFDNHSGVGSQDLGQLDLGDLQ